MPEFHVFYGQTTYYVAIIEAASKEEAEEKCRSGEFDEGELEFYENGERTFRHVE